MTAGTELAVRPDNEIIDAEFSQGRELLPAMSIQQATERYQQLVGFVKTIMKNGTDFGTVPGTDKPTLLKPGAEKLCTFFGMSARFDLIHKIEDWSGKDSGGEPLFYYVYRCRIFRGDHLRAECDGSCNSRESKYRWRWVKEHEIPPQFKKELLQKRESVASEPVFAVRGKKTDGKYGKPMAYWERFEKAIAEGTARQVTRPKRDNSGEVVYYEIHDTAYRIPNEDIASQINTIQKMSQKRALVGATLLAVNASEFFTQDVEDMEIIDAEVTDASSTGGAAAGDVAPAGGGGGDDRAAAAQTQGQQQHNPEAQFEAKWVEHATKRGFTAGTAKSLLKSTISKHTKNGTSIDDAWRADVLASLDRGVFDGLLKKPEKPASEAEANRVIEEKAAQARAKSGGGGGTPDDAEAAKIRLDEALNQPWDLACRFLRDAATEAGRAGEQFDRAIEKHVGLVLGKKGKEQTISLPQRRELHHAIKEGRFDYTTGKIRPAPQQQS